MMARRTFVVLAAMLVWSCGGDDSSTDGGNASTLGEAGERSAQSIEDPAFQKACADVPACAEPPRYEAPGPAETIWRVIVAREPSGEIRFGQVDSVEVPAGDGVPLGPLSGSHLLVGLDGSGQPVDGQLIQFPAVLRAEYPRGESPIEKTDLSSRLVDTVGYLRALPSIETLAVRDEAGNEVAEIPARPSVASTLQGVQPRLAGMAFAQSNQGSWPYQHNLPPYCSHVRLLEGEADRTLAEGFTQTIQGMGTTGDVQLAVPGPTQRALIYGILRRMTPLLCQSIGRIALVSLPAEADYVGVVQQWGMGDMILLHEPYFSEDRLTGSQRSWLPQDMMRTVAHEAGHSAESLLNAQSARPERFAGDWELPGRTLAARTIDRVRMEKSLLEEWWRLHQSFISLNWAGPYLPNDGEWRQAIPWSPRQITEAGFLSAYGTGDSAEDIAEMVGWSYVKGAFPNYDFTGWTDIQDSACQEMQRHREQDLPSRFTAVYTKLMFLQDLGLVVEEDVEACTGPDIGLPVRTAGFHFWHDGNKLRTIGNNMTAGIGTTSNGNRVFELKAEGRAAFDDKEYPAKLDLRIDLGDRGKPLHQVAWPRGVYEFNMMGDTNLRLRLDGARAGNFDAKDGYVLVAEASNDRIAGSIILTVAMRLSAPLPVPQTWRPPLIIRFLIEN